MKRIYLVFAVMLFSYACTVEPSENNTVYGNNILEQLELSLGGFNELETNGAYQVYLVQDSLEKIIIEGESNILPLIEVYIIKNKLIIENKENYNLNLNMPLKITIHHNGISNINLNGDVSLDFGDFTNHSVSTSVAGVGAIEGNIKSSAIIFTLSGSGSIDVYVECDELEATVLGNGSFVFEGKATKAIYGVAGIGAIDASKLNSNNSWCTTSGIGDVYLNVSDELNAKISGTGNIYYLGSPKLDVQISGVGKVIKLEN